MVESKEVGSSFKCGNLKRWLDDRSRIGDTTVEYSERVSTWISSWNFGDGGEGMLNMSPKIGVARERMMTLKT
jgi:hypothetical protein